MKNRGFFYSFKLRVALVLILSMVSVVGLNNFLVLHYNLNAHFEGLRDSLKMIARTAALAVDAEILTKIPLTRDGVYSSAYREVSERLRKARDVNVPVQYIYILAKTKTPGKLQFIVDTVPSSRQARDLKDTARPGDFYDASHFPEMLEGFEKPSADHELQNDPWGVTLSGYAPIVDREGKTVAILGVDIMANDIAKMQREIKRRTWVVLLLGVLVCGLFGILVSGSVSDPIRRLTEGTRQLAAGHLDHRVMVQSRDEVGELADSFNKMATSLAESRQRLKDYFFRITQSLVYALEAKDSYTRGHSERVAELTYRTALELGMTKEKAELIRHAAALHDIGKLMIHESILTKKEKLDPHEWKMLMEHPVTGEMILKPVLDEDLLRVIRSHHERVDGKGYPDGLTGDEIDLSSQIVSVADAYDAMTSLRPYRQTLTKENAMNELKRVSGTQFRADVVTAFLSVVSKAV